jgi:hypothetical protein
VYEKNRERGDEDGEGKEPPEEPCEARNPPPREQRGVIVLD